jgi:alcohol dehydrogenase class IV
MAVRFGLALPGDVRFGSGRSAELPGILTGFGVTRALVVTGRTTARADAARRALADAGVDSQVLPVAGEPSVDTVRAAVAATREAGCDGVVGYGGGSALDVAKAVALLAATGADPLDHLEVIGRGLPIERAGLPCVAVPTTAGTGSEVTRNAVLSGDGVKASLRSPLMLPRAALVDPDLLAGLASATVASSGGDALAQLVEPFLSARANPVTDALARDGLRRSARALRPAHQRGLDGEQAADLREDLALASLFGGLCLANAGLGVVHGIAGVIGGRFDAPHGAVCAALLAPAVAVNLAALTERAAGHPALARMPELGALLTGDPAASGSDAVEWLTDLRSALGIPGLSRFGMGDADVPDVVAAARRASSTKANPIELTDAELTEIITRALSR